MVKTIKARACSGTLDEDGVEKKMSQGHAANGGAVKGQGLVGRKVGMMRIFTDDGESIPVTVLDMSTNRVAQVKTAEVDGYSAVQLAFGSRRASRVTKPLAGHFAKAGIEAGNVVREFRIDASAAAELKAGATIKVDVFAAGQLVDVQGTSIGKGFQGAIRRHNFSSNRASHGNSVSHNSAGSIGMAQDPCRVFPGKKMAGHLGDVTTTVQNLEVARVDVERGLVMVRGAVPGAKNATVFVTPAVRAKAKKPAAAAKA